MLLIIKYISKKFKYPLLSDAFSKSDINCGLKVLSSKHITMSKITRNFEKFYHNLCNISVLDPAIFQEKLWCCTKIKLLKLKKTLKHNIF